MSKPFIAGLDLGQAHDFTALSVLQRALRPPDYAANAAAEPEREFHLRHLERYEQGTPYTEQVRRTAETLARPPLKGNTVLVVDATGVGRAVVDLFREAGLRPQAVTITGGQSARSDGAEHSVPKIELVSAVQACLQSGRLQFSEQMPLLEVLREELRRFRAKMTDTGHTRFEHWRDRDHDDLVLSLAIALWYGREMDGADPWFALV